MSHERSVSSHPGHCIGCCPVCVCGDPATLACVLCSTILEAPLEPQLGCISVVTVTKRLQHANVFRLRRAGRLI
eukprot:5311804-Prymnesium_polylepis.1